MMDKQGKGCLIALGLFGLVVVAGWLAESDSPSQDGAASAFADDPEKIGSFDYSAVLARTARPEDFIAAARALCAKEKICGVYAWVNESDRARTMPLLERERRAVAANYSVNRSTGFERALFDCTRFKRPENECLARFDEDETGEAGALEQ